MDNKLFFVPHTNWGSQDSGTNLKTKEIPCLTGKGKPTAETAGAVGCWYMDTDSGTVYKCIAAADGVFTWIDLVNSDELRCIVEAYLQENSALTSPDGSIWKLAITDDGTVYGIRQSSGGSAAVYGNLVLSAEELTITEGQSGMFTVTLDKAPAANQPVYLAVSDGSRLSVSPATLTFTPDNWETPQTITVTSLEDDDELDNSITVTLTSTSVDARQVAVAVVDNDGIATLVTDGLVLNMDYSGHVDDASTTIKDLASGVSFSGFDQFGKVENGIYGHSTYKYLTVVEDEAKTAFVDIMRQSGEFTLEMFGLIAPAAFYLPNYDGAFTWSGSDGFSGPLTKGDLAGKCWYTSTSGEAISGTTAQPFLFTHNGEQLNATKNNTYFEVLPYRNEFTHVVKTYSADGTVRCVVNGTPMEAPVMLEDFAEWDFGKMFGGVWSLINSRTGTETAYLSSQRIYNRVLTDDEIVQNMHYNAEKLGLATF